MSDRDDRSDLTDAWAAVHACLPAGWTVGRPSFHHEERAWHLYAWDPSERPRVGRRRRERAVSAESEAGVVRALARTLGPGGEGSPG